MAPPRAGASKPCMEPPQLHLALTWFAASAWNLACPIGPRTPLTPACERSRPPSSKASAPRWRRGQWRPAHAGCIRTLVRGAARDRTRARRPASFPGWRRDRVAGGDEVVPRPGSRGRSGVRRSPGADPGEDARPGETGAGPQTTGTRWAGDGRRRCTARSSPISRARSASTRIPRRPSGNRSRSQI